jgi:hypothetical protein
LKLESNSSHCADSFKAIAVQLLSKIGNIGIYNGALGFEGDSPDFIKQVGLAQNSSLAFEENVEKSELCRRKINDFFVESYLV